MTGTRVISAVFIAAALLVAVLWLPASWSVVALTLILVAAAWEWSAFVNLRPAPRLLFLAALAGICALWWQFSSSGQGLRLLLWAAFGWWCVITAWIIAKQRSSRALVTVAGLLGLSFAWLALARMRLDWEHGQYAVLYALLIVWVADSGAYFAGRQWGTTKLAPAISPGKTWAGLWGGLAACALLALGVGYWRELGLLSLLAVTLAAAVCSVVGDLVESLAKRHAGVKDSGTLIPGHGGVLDRFDSLLAAAPVLMLGVELLPELRG